KPITASCTIWRIEVQRAIWLSMVATKPSTKATNSRASRAAAAGVGRERSQRPRSSRQLSFTRSKRSRDAADHGTNRGREGSPERSSARLSSKLRASASAASESDAPETSRAMRYVCMRMRPASLTAAAPPSRFHETHKVRPIDASASTRKVMPLVYSFAVRVQGPRIGSAALLHQQDGNVAVADHALRNAAHERPADHAVATRAHDDHLHLFPLGHAYHFSGGRADHPGGAKLQVVLFQEALQRSEHLGSFVAVIGSDGAGPEHGLDPRRYGRLHVQHHQLVIGADEAFMGDQKSSRLLGVLAVVRGQQYLHRIFQRSTSTGMLLWVRTCCVSLPSRMRLKPLRPCEAITIRSHLLFFAVDMIASATRSDLETTALALTLFASAACCTASTTAWPWSAHCFSVRAMSCVDTVIPPSK